MKLKDIHAQTVHRFREADIETAELDTQLLICHVYDISKEFLLLNPDTEKDENKLSEVVSRRLTKEPISKIIGEKGFWDYLFYTNQHTLDPRPDSETLIETVLKILPDKEKQYRFLDLGTGTGCLIQTLLLLYKNASGIAIDASEEALKAATQNAQRHDLEDRLVLQKGSWNETLFFDEKFDLVISNPPYIPSAEIESLSEDVKNHDPLLALDGGGDGLQPYRNIVRLLPSLLKAGGWVVFEIGQGQEKDIEKMLLDSGVQTIDMTRDLGKIIRCVFARMP